MYEEEVEHPAHYGGEDDPFEVMKVLEAWDLELAKGFAWGNLIKYTARAGKKDSEVSDRLKAEWYAHRLTTITATLEGRKQTAAASKASAGGGGSNNTVNYGFTSASIPGGGGGPSTRPENCEMPNLRPLGKRHDGTDEQ